MDVTILFFVKNLWVTNTANGKCIRYSLKQYVSMHFVSNHMSVAVLARCIYVHFVCIWQTLINAKELPLFQFASSAVPSRKSLASTQVARIQRERDFLR